ncbi:C45 family peptidase [Gillisia sp. M10.2A]|uniref:C45 family peptidase n=1 Tax=Gillisia lutea TaxID=2909668 RepID=A0ABS9EFG9_9FLAO|nr:C45 family peptidase [Gillisia lutea]MCF4101630.1 C45 family peptidase [Gillisia lutea]
MRKIYFKFIVVFLISLTILACGGSKSVGELPDISDISKIDTLRIKHNDSSYSIGKNTLNKNKYGIWELYVEGDALERGMVNGSLTRELMDKQEVAFMNKLESMVPSKTYQKFLSKLIAYFNRKIDSHITTEYKQEIFGISRFTLRKYDTFAPAYKRALYLHGAHDIGHALQDLMLVGCTSFAAWDNKTANGQLLVGRNFDFYAGDEFSKEKIVAFFNPSKGHKFMIYTWGGFVGAVSGMNEFGLTVTLNAGKSKIPLVAKTPISLVAREILQYATTTQQAIEIAAKREVFVSESIMVGSAKENKAILIEVSPSNFGVFEVENSNQLICSNQFQSEEYTFDKRNLETITQSHTAYRFKKMQELVSQTNKLTPEKAVDILRNRQGLDGIKLGMGNEKAINQLLAHHGIVFQPQERKVWISANPYQLGAFIAYDLDEVFERFEKDNVRGSVANFEEVIGEDPFMRTEQFHNYEEYRKLKLKVVEGLKKGTNLSEQEILRLSHLNPNYWEAYSLAGLYYFQKKEYKKAIINFKQAKRREVTTLPDVKYLDKMTAKAYRKL